LKFEHFNAGDVQGTISEAVRYHFVPNDVRRHRLIPISSILLLPYHSPARWNWKEKEQEGTGRNQST
jgi:hypothetical protein